MEFSFTTPFVAAVVALLFVGIYLYQRANRTKSTPGGATGGAGKGRGGDDWDNDGDEGER